MDGFAVAKIRGQKSDQLGSKDVSSTFGFWRTTAEVQVGNQHGQALPLPATQHENKPGTLDHFGREYPGASCTGRATSVRVGGERLCRL